MTSYGPWTQPDPYWNAQKYTYHYGGYTDPWNAPVTQMMSYAGGHFYPLQPSDQDGMDFLGAGMPFNYWAASVYMARSASWTDGWKSGVAEAARLDLSVAQDYPFFTPTLPSGATGIEREVGDGSHPAGDYSGLFRVGAEWEVRSAGSNFATATGYLGRFFDQEVTTLINPGSWAVLDSQSARSRGDAPSQNILWSAEPADTQPTRSRTVIFDTPDTFVGLGVFTASNVSPPATPAPTYGRAGDAYGWYADGARIHNLGVSRFYTPTRYRFVYGNSAPRAPYTSAAGAGSGATRFHKGGRHGL